MRRAARLFWVLLLIVSCLALLSDLRAEPYARQRIAFVVGINTYDNLGIDHQLVHPFRDAKDVAKELSEQLGFEIVSVPQEPKQEGRASAADFKKAWNQFKDKVQKDDTVIVFLSGHGAQIETDFYFATSDVPYSQFSRTEKFKRETIKLSELMQDLAERRPRLVMFIIDACRTNPFIPVEYPHPTRGASVVVDGMIVIFSATAGEAALDRLPPPYGDRNSLFTTVLLTKIKELKSASMPVFREWCESLKKGVKDITDKIHYEQHPRVYFEDSSDTVLSDAISQTQNMIVAVSHGCSGGPNGVPPVNWGALQVHGNTAVNAFSAARTALATGQTPVAVQQINSGLSELDALVNGLHMTCSGGAHGEDPVNYGGLKEIKATVKAKLDVVKLILGG